MRFHKLPLVMTLLAFVGLNVLQAQPDQPDKQDPPKPAPAFKPLDIQGELKANDPNDPDLNNPSKRYTVKLQKDRTYIIDMISKDFDAYLRLLDRDGNQLAEDDDAGGDLNSKIIHSTDKAGDYQIVATTFDGQLGKFNLKVRGLVLKGEAKSRAIGKDGLSITDNIAQGNTTEIGKLGKLYSVNLKAGETYTIDLESQAMDSYLYLFNANSKLLEQDDDSGDDLNSRITFRADRDGVYHILASTLDGDETGEFTLKVRKND